MSVLLRYLPLVLLAVAWELAARLGLVSQLALPPLSQVSLAWVEMLKSGELLDNGASSLWRAGAEPVPAALTLPKSLRRRGRVLCGIGAGCNGRAAGLLF